MRLFRPEKTCAVALSIFSHFLCGLIFFSLVGEIVAKYKTMQLKGHLNFFFNLNSFKFQILPPLSTKVFGNYDEGFVFSLLKLKSKYFGLYVYFG